MANNFLVQQLRTEHIRTRNTPKDRKLLRSDQLWFETVVGNYRQFSIVHTIIILLL
jgi:hypothetical protein